MRKRLLVVASDAGLRMVLARWLAAAGYAIELAEAPRKAREVLASGKLAGCILRVERPDEAVLALASRVRDLGVGLIAIVDEVAEIERLKRVGLGADSYLVQPLKRREVLAGAASVMQPPGEDGSAETAETIAVNGVTLDIAGHCFIDAAGREVKLTRAELALLATLLRRPGQVLSRDRLLDAVSSRNSDAFDRSIDNLVARLRRKIERDAGNPRLILSVRGAGYKFSSRPEAGDAPPFPSAQARCSILILPFANLGDAPALSLSMAGVSTLLTAELRHIVGAQVRCHPEGGADAVEVGRLAAVRYVLRGNARRSGDTIRVTAEMIETGKGVLIWADRFDHTLQDAFAFDSEVAARISRAVDLALVERESRRVKDAAGGFDVLDLVTQGYSYLYRPRSAENLASARDLFERTLRLDDRCAEALAGLAQTHVSDTLCLWSRDPDGQVRLAEALAARAIEINPRLAYAYHVRGLALRVQQQAERALAAFDRAVQLNPSLAATHVEIGFARQALDRGQSAMARAHDALALARRISPRDPVLANWLFGVGAMHLRGGEVAEAIRWLTESAALNPMPPTLAYLAAAYALEGDDQRAQSALREFRRKHPRETLRAFGESTLADSPTLPGSRVLNRLRRMGLRAL
jgi:DNA-binding response OmpR family regulator/TolB-like protein